MQKNKFNSTRFIFALICAMLLIFPILSSNITAYAEVYVNLSYYETDTSYTIEATPSEAIPYSYEIVFVVNDLSIVSINGELTVEKDNTTTFTVYCIIRDTSETPTYSDVQSQTITITPIDGEDNLLLSPAMQLLFKTLLPLIVLIVCIVLIVLGIKKKKYSPFGHLVRKLKSVQKIDKEVVALFKDEKASSKIKSRKYRKFLKTADKVSYSCISKIIPINIESMGQYNSLLENLFNLNNIIQAGVRTYSKTNIKQKERVVNELHRNLLPNAIINAEETNSAWEKQLLKTEKQFVQQSLYKKTLASDKDYQQLLKKTVFYQNNQKLEGDDGQME
ncbi:MAG: hypothetical protein AB7S44_03080 [Spirochaetales bacterium]